MLEFGAARAARASAVAALLSLAACSRPIQPEPELHSPRAVARNPGAVPAARSTGLAVVELFTSEGCSSCPPADRVLSRLASRAAAESLPVYTLSFHVDYWNYLGWADRFSSSSYSERQRGYASLNPSGGTYTPQAVINGADECVGSDAAHIDSLIAAALKRPSRSQVELQARRSEGGIEVSYRVTGDTAGRVLNLALLEAHVESVVKSGENAGERLAHVNVVRAFTSRPLAPASAGSWSVTPSADFGTQRVGVVAYAEDATQRDVSGATALELD